MEARCRKKRKRKWRQKKMMTNRIPMARTTKKTKSPLAATSLES